MKHMLTVIFYNFVHVFLFFLVPFQIITSMCDVNGFWNFSFLCFLVSCWSVAQTVMYIKLFKKFFPNTFAKIMKDVENV